MKLRRKAGDPFFERAPRQWQFGRAVENVAAATVLLIVAGIVARALGL